VQQAPEVAPRSLTAVNSTSCGGDRQSEVWRVSLVLGRGGVGDVVLQLIELVDGHELQIT